MRRGIRHILALLASAVLTLIAVEASVRALGIAPKVAQQIGDLVADSVLLYRHKPGSVARGRSESDEYDFEYRHNSLGFRDIERSRAKPPGTFRIVTLGDSFTYGEGATFDATWPSRLERLLNDAFPDGVRAEVLRFGLRRYYPGAARPVLETEGLPFSPDLVIVGVVPNDVVDTHLGPNAVFVDDDGFLRRSSGANLGRLGTWLFFHSHAMRIVLRRLTLSRQQADASVNWDDVYREGGVHEDDWRTMEADLDSIAAVSRANGADVMVVSLPMRGPWSDGSAYPDARLGRWAEARGVDFVGLFEPTRERVAAGDTLFWPRDGHPTPAGYDFIARRLVDSVRAIHARRASPSSPQRRRD